MTLEELQLEHIKLQEENKTLKATNDSLSVKITQHEEKEKTTNDEITKLKENNMALFLKVTSNTTTPPEEPKEIEVIDINTLIQNMEV